MKQYNKENQNIYFFFLTDVGVTMGFFFFFCNNFFLLLECHMNIPAWIPVYV